MLWQCVGVSQAQASELWACLWRSTDPNVRAFRYMLDYYHVRFADGTSTEQTPYEFLRNVWTGKLLIDALERCVIDQHLDRKRANYFEELFLRQMNSYGGWKFRKVMHDDVQRCGLKMTADRT
jgi:hypothetical protein